MAVVKGPQDHGPGPIIYGPQSFLELIGGFAVLGAAAAGIYLLFYLPSLLAGLWALLAGTVVGPLPLLGDMLSSLVLGVIAGAVVGAIRIRLNRRSAVIDELVGAVLSQDAITAAKVRWSAAALAIAIGAGSGLAIGRLGIFNAGDTSATVVGPLLAGACFWGCPPGAGGGGDPFVALVAIALIVVLLTVLLSLGVTAVFVAGAKGLATGAAQGVGHAVGIATAIAVSRLRTTALTQSQYGRPGKLTFEGACAQFVDQGPAERREIVEPFLNWLRSRGLAVATMGAHIDAYCAQSARALEFEAQNVKTSHLTMNPNDPEWNEQKHLRVPRGIARRAAAQEKAVLYALADEVPRLVARQDPTLRMTATDGAPVFDGLTATLFHPRFLQGSLLTGMRDGAIVGAVGAVLSLGVLLVSR